MDKRRMGRDALVVSAMCFGTGVLLTWAFISDPNAMTAADIEWPAWVQAVGSLIGIAVAIAVPTNIAQRERSRIDRDALLRSRSYALMLVTRADELLSAIRAARYTGDGEEDGTYAKARGLLLERSRGDWVLLLHELGTAAEPLQSALAAAADLASLLDDWDFYEGSGGFWYNENTGPEDFPPPALLTPLIDIAEGHAQRAAVEIRSLLIDS